MTSTPITTEILPPAPSADGGTLSDSSAPQRRLPRLQDVVRRIGSTIATTISGVGPAGGGGGGTSIAQAGAGGVSGTGGLASSGAGSQAASASQKGGTHRDILRDCLRKFDSDEVEVLQKVFKELSSRGAGSGIDKQTFLEYVPLPGLWGERLFQKFDYKNTGFIDYEEFLVGMAVCCRGTKNERIRVIFQIFDLNGDGTLQHQELVTMFSNLPRLDRYLQHLGPSINKQRSDFDGTKFMHYTHGEGEDATIVTGGVAVPSEGEVPPSSGAIFGRRQEEGGVADSTVSEWDFAPSEKGLPEKGRVSNAGEGNDSDSTSINPQELAPQRYEAELDFDDEEYEAGDDELGGVGVSSNSDNEDDDDDSVYNDSNVAAARTGSATIDGEGGARASLSRFPMGSKGAEEMEGGVMTTTHPNPKESGGVAPTPPLVRLGSRQAGPSEKVFPKVFSHEDDAEFSGNRSSGGPQTTAGSAVGGGGSAGRRRSQHQRLSSTTADSLQLRGAESDFISKNVPKSNADSQGPPDRNLSLSQSSFQKKPKKKDASSRHLPSVLSAAIVAASEAPAPFDVESFVDKIIEGCENPDAGSLSFVEFKTWLEKNDAILKMFTDCLHEEAWGLQGNALYRRGLARGSNSTSSKRVPALFPPRRGGKAGGLVARSSGRDSKDLPSTSTTPPPSANLVDIRPDSFYKIKRLFNPPTSQVAVLHQQQSRQHRASTSSAKFGGSSSGFLKSWPSHSSTVTAGDAAHAIPMTSTEILPPAAVAGGDSRPPLPVDHNATKGLFAAAAPTSADMVSSPPPSAIGGASAIPMEIYPKQTREVLTTQLMHCVMETNPEADLSRMSERKSPEDGADGGVGAADSQILWCPNCKCLLVMCPTCLRRSLKLRLRSGDIVIECGSCAGRATTRRTSFVEKTEKADFDKTPVASGLDAAQEGEDAAENAEAEDTQSSDVGEFRACWHCNWDFSEAPSWVDQCEPLHEGTLYKIGKHMRNWRSRYFVLVDNLLYYYAKKEDTKPRGFIFLEGCFVEPICGSNTSDWGGKKEGGEPGFVSSSSGAAAASTVVGKGLRKLANRTNSTPPQTSQAHAGIPPSGAAAAANQGVGKYGFSIIHGGGKVPRRDMYAASSAERETWLNALRTAMNQQKVEQNYELGEFVGQGKFSVVYRATARDTKHEVAIKVIDKSKISGHEWELLRSELAILRLLRHPHVINLKEILDSQKNIYIVMEYVKGGELLDLFYRQKCRLPEIQVNRIIHQLLTTVAYLHKCGIIHRDLKPENILLTDRTGSGSIKVTDFGLSCICGLDEVVTQPCGTLAYVAPEVLTLKGYQHKVDVWSVGVIMYLLLRGRLPFPLNRGGSNSKPPNYTLLFKGSALDAVSSSAKDLLRKLLQVNPDERISAEQALQHIWIKNPTAVVSEGDPEAVDVASPPVAQPLAPAPPAVSAAHTQGSDSGHEVPPNEEALATEFAVRDAGELSAAEVVSVPTFAVLPAVVSSCKKVCNSDGTPAPTPPR